MNVYKTIGDSIGFGWLILLVGINGLNQAQATEVKYAQVRAFEDFSSLIAMVTQTHLENIAKTVTVKVIAAPLDWGSGVLVNVKDQTYTVITNDHVIEPGQAITIVTPDQVRHKGILTESLRSKGSDIAVLQFQSKNAYNTVAMGSYQSIGEGDFTFASGFPLEVANSNRPYGFKITSGNISLKLDKPLTQAYQMGYTNDIERGMSGGPVLDINGSLVAINGRSRWALVPQRFRDKTMPCLPIRNIISSSSWAIPISVVISQSQKLTPLNLNYYAPTSKTLLLGTPSVLEPNNIKYIFPNIATFQFKKSLKVRADIAKQCKPSS